MGTTPATPTYNTTAATASQNALRDDARADLYANYQSGLGGQTWDSATNTMNVNYNQADQNRLGLIDQGVSNLNMDPNQATDAYFQQSMKNMQPELEKYMNKTNTSLINKGLPIGSQAYGEVMRQQDNNISNQIANMYSNARSQSLSDQNAQIGNIGNLQNQIYTPQQLAGIGATGLTDQYGQKFQNEMDIYNAKVSSQNATKAAIGAGVGGIAGGLIGLSDKRLKENLVLVGTLFNGLNVYCGNYIEEVDPNKIPQLFLIAQEVLEVKPEAVETLDINGTEYLAVDYQLATNNDGE